MSNITSWKGYEENIASSKDLFDYFREPKWEEWIFRGQFIDWELKTTLERACENSGLRSVDDVQKIENNMIREFQRIYEGNDRDRVETDKLYALSMMRHYGAPTRLLDFTYSKYIGIYFALEYAHDNKIINKQKCCAIWCINRAWLYNSACLMSKEVEKLVNERGIDEKRNDNSFIPLYLCNEFDFVGWENPLGLHQRLHVQQGTFLCPGNIKKSFMENLLELKGWDEKGAIIKVVCRMSLDDLNRSINECKRMNISRESLFPGLDGFARSMEYHLHFYKSTYDERIAFI
jgi:FRG domain